VSNWERRGTNARLRTQTQCDLDAALKLADDDARERFSAAVPQRRARMPLAYR
jgi:hypothetical protein